MNLLDPDYRSYFIDLINNPIFYAWYNAKVEEFYIDNTISSRESRITLRFSSSNMVYLDYIYLSDYLNNNLRSRVTRLRILPSGFDNCSHY